MAHGCGPDHVQVDAHQATLKMANGGHRGGAIAVLPKCATAPIPAVEFPGDARLGQLHAACDGVTTGVIRLNVEMSNLRFQAQELVQFRDMRWSEPLAL